MKTLLFITFINIISLQLSAQSANKIQLGIGANYLSFLSNTITCGLHVNTGFKVSQKSNLALALNFSMPIKGQVVGKNIKTLKIENITQLNVIHQFTISNSKYFFQNEIGLTNIAFKTANIVNPNIGIGLGKVFKINDVSKIKITTVAGTVFKGFNDAGYLKFECVYYG